MFLNEDFRDFIKALNQFDVDYILVGGYAVILRGYSRSTGDLDVWVHPTRANFQNLTKALALFGLPLEAVPEHQFFSSDYDVFSFGLPPSAIEVMTVVKGLDFEETFQNATIEILDDVPVRIIHLKQLLQAKKASGRHKDWNDIENLPSE